MNTEVLQNTVIKDANFLEFDLLEKIPWLKLTFFGNSVFDYILTCLTFLLLWALLRTLRKHTLKYVGHAGESLTDQIWQFCGTLSYRIKGPVYTLIAFYFAAKHLKLATAVEHAFHILTVSIVTIQLIALFGDLLAYLICRSRGGHSRPDDLAIRNTNDNLITLIRIALWTAGSLFLLDNAGFNVSTFVAGLGIGGVAIALAAQAILGDTFSSFAIALDKPFEIGDFITVDSLQGTVEYIGLKTTRVRSVGGEMLIFPNSDLTKSRIRNYKKMHKRRVQFKIAVHPTTNHAKLQLIPNILGNIVKTQEIATLDYAAFAGISESALIFEVVYHVNSPDYRVFITTHQNINFSITETMGKEAIILAFAAPQPLTFS